MSDTTNHTSDGKFKPGNKAGQGNPTSRARKVRLRLKRCVMDEMMKNDAEPLKSIAEGLVARAKESDASLRLLCSITETSATDLGEDVASLKRVVTKLKGAQ